MFDIPSQLVGREAPADLQEVTSLSSALTTARRNALSGPQPDRNRADVLQRYIDELNGFLDDAVGGETAGQLATARGVSRDVNERFFESKQSPLHLVCTKEKPAERLIPLLELLIKAGAAPNQPDVDGLTPLMACNSPEIAVFLMNHGANPSLRNDDGQTAYDFHMKNGYPPIAEAIKNWQAKQKKAEAAN